MPVDGSQPFRIVNLFELWLCAPGANCTEVGLRHVEQGTDSCDKDSDLGSKIIETLNGAEKGHKKEEHSAEQVELQQDHLAQVADLEQEEVSSQASTEVLMQVHFNIF